MAVRALAGGFRGVQLSLALTTMTDALIRRGDHELTINPQVGATSAHERRVYTLRGLAHLNLNLTCSG
jgi:hypothetical protein